MTWQWKVSLVIRPLRSLWCAHLVTKRKVGGARPKWGELSCALAMQQQQQCPFLLVWCCTGAHRELFSLPSSSVVLWHFGARIGKENDKNVRT